MTINHKLVYELWDTGLKTDCLSNLKVRYRNEADVRAEKDHKAYTDWLRKRLPAGSIIDVTNIMCEAKGVLGHVYVCDSETTPRGLGKRICCFCGLDDFDD